MTTTAKKNKSALLAGQPSHDHHFPGRRVPCWWRVRIGRNVGIVLDCG
jgi:hypothetical protein